MKVVLWFMIASTVLISGCIEPRQVNSQSAAGNSSNADYRIQLVSIPLIDMDCFQSEDAGWICHHLSAGDYSQLPLMKSSYDTILIGNGTIWHLYCTSSMYPTIWCNQTYIAITSNDYISGDIIWFKRSSGTDVIHRINSTAIDSNGLYYMTKGDNNVDIDEWQVRPADIRFKIIGRYVT